MGMLGKTERTTTKSQILTGHQQPGFKVWRLAVSIHITYLVIDVRRVASPPSVPQVTVLMLTSTPGDH